MTEGVRPLIAGNWKMNGLRAAVAEALAVRDAVSASGFKPAVDVMICPPATLVMAMSELAKGSRLEVGGQDCHTGVSGAHTGDIAPEMLADAGATAVILGHSERRADHGERDAEVRAKAKSVYRAGLKAIVCIGETEGQRTVGLTMAVIGRQLKASLPDEATSANTIIAYEPVWAIGTGLTPTVGDVRQIHAAIRADLVARFAAEGGKMRILYGGSVKPSNAKELMSVDNVDGALVGGASLKASDFLGIIGAYA